MNATPEFMSNNTSTKKIPKRAKISKKQKRKKFSNPM